MSKLKPRMGQIVLKPLEESEMMVGNIIIPDVGNEKTLTATIVAVSDVYNYHRGELIPTDLEVGMKVVVPPMGVQKHKLNNEEYLITSQENILSIIED
jgi:co-chaperonin GroES (HSP10)